MVDFVSLCLRGSVTESDERQGKGIPNCVLSRARGRNYRQLHNLGYLTQGAVKDNSRMSNRRWLRGSLKNSAKGGGKMTMLTTAGASPLTAARQLLAQRDFAAAIEILVAQVDGQQDGEGHALLALAYFQSAQYAAAEKEYALALQQDPANADWQTLRQQAAANAKAEVNVFVPDMYFFDRDKLLAKATVPAGALPAAPPPAPGPGGFTQIRIALGDALGVVASLLMGGATELYGRLAGYRDVVWTNWYRRPFILAILTLAYMREQLNTHNLKNTYPKGALTGFQPEGETPPPGVTHFRTADGTWNNLADPKEGAAFTRFMRNVANRAIRPATGDELLSPNPREISRIFLTRQGEMKEVPFLNMLAASWIQFQNHDWINHGEVVPTDVIAVPLAEDDPARRRYWQTQMFVAKTQADPTWQGPPGVAKRRHPSPLSTK